jgi:hypothetical protein
MNVITAAGPRKEPEMKTFTVDHENQIHIAAGPANAPDSAGAKVEHFGCEAELAGLASNWPAARLIAIWNGLPGVVPVEFNRISLPQSPAPPIERPLSDPALPTERPGLLPTGLLFGD